MSEEHLVPSTHPLRSAAWIWPDPTMYLYNHYTQFRRDFQLAEAPGQAPLSITADKAYKLYVNGCYVCRGPARGYQSHWPVDEVDLAPLLRPGHNWIAVEAYNPGISTYQYLHQSCAGLLAAACWPGGSATGPGWLMRRSPMHATQTARLSLQTDFQEHVDARAGGRDWIEVETPPRAGVDGWETSRRGIPFGRPPWDDVEPRGIPLMREERVAPKAVAQTTGACGEGYRAWENVSWGWVREAEALAWDDASGLSAEADGDALRLSVGPTGAGRFRAVALDPGEYLVGNLVVEVEGATGAEILDFQHCEAFVDGRAALVPPGDACRIAMANRLRPARGACAHEFFHLMGFGCAVVVARDVERPITLRVSVRRAGYPFAMRGRFACSDDLLNEIHAICRRTQGICALDAYVDTPWREQAQWWGDARVQAANTFYLDGDARLLARGIRSIAGQRGPGGLTYGHAPTCAHNCVLPDFSLTWILTLWDHYWQTGDLALFREQWGRVQEVLGYFDSPEARGRHGLLRHDRRLWYFGDWARLFKGETPTLLNLWYLLALRRLTDLLGAAGVDAAAGEWRSRADEHEARVLEHLYDADARLFRDGLDERGAPAPRASVHEQTVALMLGLTPEAHASMLSERLLPYVRGEELDCSVPSAFWCTYVLGELGRRGYGPDVVDFVRRRWEPMLVTGTTWEEFTWSPDSGNSASHAWSAHPAFHLVNVLVGLRQTAPRWAQVELAPCLSAGVERASALVPAPPGDVEASWERSGGTVTARLRLPEGVAARIELPGRSAAHAGPGEFELEAEDV